MHQKYQKYAFKYVLSFTSLAPANVPLEQLRSVLPVLTITHKPQ
jgi:hypothetical protein